MTAIAPTVGRVMWFRPTEDDVRTGYAQYDTEQAMRAHVDYVHVDGTVNVTITERPSREVGLSVGYGTDDGARAEAAFRHRNLLENLSNYLIKRERSKA